MLKIDGQSRLFCVHHIPSDIDCVECQKSEKDYPNRSLYAPLSKLSKALNQSQLKLPETFYVPMNSSKVSTQENCVNIETNQGLLRVPRSALISRSKIDGSNTGNSQGTFPGAFQKQAHRFTRSFSWKTKPEESPFIHMQPLPKLVKKPGYAEICFKSEKKSMRLTRWISSTRYLLANSSTLSMLWSKYGGKLS